MEASACRRMPRRPWGQDKPLHVRVRPGRHLAWLRFCPLGRTIPCDAKEDLEEQGEGGSAA